MKDLFTRTAKTFIQAFAGAFVVSGPAFDTLFTLRNLELGVAAGCFAILMNLRGAVTPSE